ncbi:MAG TPA: glycosyltransferase [Verrucomicrobiae bacterium]|jgi:glycosyltransferase involved in cell wall biosynthesis|nr:glycosyltransferase [Verrucomicrobiae bacterium]
MKISIVIPAFNEEKLIAATLTAIQHARGAFQLRGWESELIVCDNNSTDRTAEIARAGGATVVFEPMNQIGRARNCGAAAATGDWLIFVDADSHPSRELFNDVADKIQTGRYLFGGSTVKLDAHYSFARFIVEGWNWISRIWKYAAGSFIFCETAAFRQIGGFDTKLFASEEIDLSQRLKELARANRKRGIILHRHPLITSARKIHLYSSKEHLLFLARTVFGLGRTLKSREACHTWYDGRR